MRNKRGQITRSRSQSKMVSSGARILGQKGFTLVEILVVIAIIAMLSTLAVNGYISYRRQTVLDFAADNLISQINQLHSKALYGEVSGERLATLKGSEEPTVAVTETAANCFGMKFEKFDDEYMVQSYVVPFNGKKEWKLGEWQYVGCPEPSDEQLQPVELEPEVKILAEDRVFYLVAEPPEGKMNKIPGDASFALTLVNRNAQTDKRVISVDLAALKFSKGYGK